MALNREAIKCRSQWGTEVFRSQKPTIPLSVYPSGGDQTVHRAGGVRSRQERAVRLFSVAPELDSSITSHAASLETTLEEDIDRQIALLSDLVSRLTVAKREWSTKVDTMLQLPTVETFFATRQGKRLQEPILNQLDHPRRAMILCIIAMGQHHLFEVVPCNGDLVQALEELADDMLKLEEFYDSIGGLAGYQLQCLRLIAEQQAVKQSESTTTAKSTVEFLVPPGLDISQPDDAAHAAFIGLLGMPRMAEIYPLGGAGDRLGLCCDETGDSLPTACLPYCGRSLLETLLRDLQAREYLYFRLYGVQLTTPVAVMTSAAKGNHWRVRSLFEQADWFGRSPSSFTLFQQPLVPVVSANNGQWLTCSPLKPVMKPGGHGVIWKLMLDRGVFDWLRAAGRDAAVVRQISNPMAGQDTTLLALTGQGLRGEHAFGFASCERVVGAAEGMNVLIKETDARIKSPTGPTFRITNVEYTEFEKLGIQDKGAEEGSLHSAFPANTNVLFVGLPQVESIVRAGVEAGTTDAILPGMILNLNKKVCHMDPLTGAELHTHGGRLECTMQNLADCLKTPLKAFTGGRPVEDQSLQPDVPAIEDLDTFLVYGPRRKVTSSAKRQRSPGSTKIHQTPDGSLYDLLQNAADMLSLCGIFTPPLGSVAEYLDRGPGFLFFFHPALGPLWQIVAQKIRGGRLAPRSEVQLEIAEVDIANFDVDGSFIVIADAPLGRYDDGLSSSDGPLLKYSGDTCGRMRLKNVKIQNRGIDWSHPDNVYWRHRVERKECCRVLLHGNAEFDAADVELSGDLTFEVPEGHRMVVRAGFTELIKLESPTWRWRYEIESDSLCFPQTGNIKLYMVEP